MTAFLAWAWEHFAELSLWLALAIASIPAVAVLLDAFFAPRRVRRRWMRRKGGE